MFAGGLWAKRSFVLDVFVVYLPTPAVSARADGRADRCWYAVPGYLFWSDSSGRLFFSRVDRAIFRTPSTLP